MNNKDANNHKSVRIVAEFILDMSMSKVRLFPNPFKSLKHCSGLGVSFLIFPRFDAWSCPNKPNSRLILFRFKLVLNKFQARSCLNLFFGDWWQPFHHDSFLFRTEHTTFVDFNFVLEKLFMALKVAFQISGQNFTKILKNHPYTPKAL